jgi:hypothetical protein
MHAVDQFLSRERRLQRRIEHDSQSTKRRHRQCQRDHDVPCQAHSAKAQSADDSGAAQQRDAHGVEPRKESSETYVDDAGSEKQLEPVGRDAEQVEQERHCNSETAEERKQTRQREVRIFRRRHRRIGEPAGEQDEADGQELTGMGKIEGRGDDHFRQRPCPLVDIENVQRDLLALHADKRDTEKDKEQNDRRDDVVRQRVERIGRNK